MDFLSHSQCRLVLPEVAQPRLPLLGLHEHEVSPLAEVALEEKMRFLFLLRLADELQHFGLLLPVEVGAEWGDMLDVAERNTALP